MIRPGIHATIDLETLDTLPSATVLSVGGVKFRPDSSDDPYDRFYMKILVDDQDKLGRTASDDTIEWWGKQDPKAMEEAFGKKPVPVRSGGSIPIVALFEQVLGMKSILLGFGLDSDAIHSPNEHYGLFNYYKGIETIPYFYKYYAEMK